jgi:thioredoxin reductase (NADPH)
MARGVPDDVHYVSQRSGTKLCYLFDGRLALARVRTARGNELEGVDGMLEAIRWRNGSGEEGRRAIRHLFLFIGATPNTEWLAGSGVDLDAKGFVMTGSRLDLDRGPLETSRHGIFAVGDVRSGSVKRVAAGVGEGAQVVAALHAFLSLRRTELAPAAGLHERSH